MQKIVKWNEDYGQYKAGDVFRLDEGNYQYFKESGKIVDASEAEEKEFLKKIELPNQDLKPGVVERAEIETESTAQKAEIKTDKKK